MSNSLLPQTVPAQTPPANTLRRPSKGRRSGPAEIFTMVPTTPEPPKVKVPRKSLMDELKESGITIGSWVKVVSVPKKNMRIYWLGSESEIGKSGQVSQIESDGRVRIKKIPCIWPASCLKLEKDRLPAIKVLVKVHNKLTREALTTSASRAKIFMLGRDEKTGVIVHALKLVFRQPPGGCHEMPSIPAHMLAESYIKLARKGLHACGLARVNKEIANTPSWRGHSGPGIYNLGGGMVLSYNSRTVVAQQVRNRKLTAFPYKVVNTNNKEKEEVQHATQSNHAQKRRGLQPEDQGAIW